jgi:hypothetical protein
MFVHRINQLVFVMMKYFLFLGSEFKFCFEALRLQNDNTVLRRCTWPFKTRVRRCHMKAMGTEPRLLELEAKAATSGTVQQKLLLLTFYSRLKFWISVTGRHDMTALKFSINPHGRRLSCLCFS